MSRRVRVTHRVLVRYNVPIEAYPDMTDGEIRDFEMGGEDNDVDPGVLLDNIVDIESTVDFFESEDS